MQNAKCSGRTRTERGGACCLLSLHVFFSFFIFHFSFCLSALAFDRTNVPLKNWGGFSLHRSWVYDALEKIVLAGLADQVLLNTKPLSRVEAARIVAEAVHRVAADQLGDYGHRGYLEDLLYRLVEEFGSELAEMGVETPINRAMRMLPSELKPIDHIQFGADFAGRSQRIVNHFGQRDGKGANLRSTLDGRARIGDLFSFYYEPEFSWDRDRSTTRLMTGYGKFTLWNTEIEVGRDSLWWGPGFRGSMSLSNNGFPLDQVRFSSAEPFLLPWLFRYLGPVKASLLVAQLDDDRDSKVGGWRIGLAPSRFVEIGFSRMFQFGGRGRGTVHPGRFIELLFTQGSDDPDSPVNVNNIMSFDGALRIPDVERYILVARDAAFYFDFGWDDTLFGLIVPNKPGGIVGTYLAGLFGDPRLDLRIEYAQTSDIQFTHNIYRSGFTNRGSVLSHFIGTKGSELYVRASRWVNEDLLVGFQTSYAAVGPTEAGSLSQPREKRNSFGLDFSFRISDLSSIFLAYDFTRVKDRGFVAGKSGFDHLFRIEFTRSFRPH